MSTTKLWLRLLSLGCLVMVVPAAAGKVITNGTDWKDTTGQPISAHEHFVGRFFGGFYWYGTSYKGNPFGQCGLEGAPLQNGFNVYRSTNLVDWEHLGECLKFPKSGFGSEGTSHRPCVLYNKPTKKYVMWYFYFRKYPDVMLTVATADSPSGPFAIQGLRKSGEEHGWAQDLGTPRRLGNWGTWGSQISNFLYVAETDTLIALCDQWWAGPAGRNDLDQSRYVWVPVSFNPSTRQAQATYHPEWDPFSRGAQ